MAILTRLILHKTAYGLDTNLSMVVPRDFLQGRIVLIDLLNLSIRMSENFLIFLFFDFFRIDSKRKKERSLVYVSTDFLFMVH